MNTSQTPRLILVSGACCNPNLKKMDTLFEQTLAQAITDLGLSLNVEKVSLSGVLNNKEYLTPKQHFQITALFKKYGSRFTPALMINEEVRFAGNLPTTEQLKEVLAKEVAPHL